MFELVHLPRPLGLGAAGGRGTLGVHGLRLLSRTLSGQPENSRAPGDLHQPGRQGPFTPLNQHHYRCERVSQGLTLT